VVYPACAGIHRHAIIESNRQASLPRMRGDPPPYNYEANETIQSTPHARGSTLRGLVDENQIKVYPACAGIHPSAVIPKQAGDCLPRMRGDPPLCVLLCPYTQESTPHARGSTLRLRIFYNLKTVYPACAGIHLESNKEAAVNGSLPRMRGDPP